VIVVEVRRVPVTELMCVVGHQQKPPVISVVQVVKLDPVWDAVRLPDCGVGRAEPLADALPHLTGAPVSRFWSWAGSE